MRLGESPTESGARRNKSATVRDYTDFAGRFNRDPNAEVRLMQILMLAATATGGRLASDTPLGNSFAMLLFMSGAVSLGIAAYLLYKAPKPSPVRISRRRY
jgi:hypothetical protein